MEHFSIRKRLLALFLVLLLMCSLATSAFAATYSAGDRVTVYHDFALPFKLKERNAEGFPWMATGYLTNALIPPSGASWVYCIDYWHSASGGTYTTTDLMQTSAWTSLSPVAQNGITLATIYGCPNNGVNDIYSYAATQLIIWEYQLGQRTNPTQTVSYFNATLNQNTTLKSYYNSILSTMSQHYLAPSFSGSTVTLNGYGRANGVTLTDTNGKLGNDSWSIATVAGFHAEQSGNNLLIYADESVAASSTTTVTLRRSLSVSTGSALGITVGGQKAILGVPPDPVSAALTVEMAATGSLTIQKTSDTDVADYCFKVYKHTDNLSWYGKSDSAGNVYVTNSSYTASGTKVYTFTGMTDGTYTFLEVLSQKGKDLVFPDSWRITVTKDGTAQFDHTYTASDLSRDSNGDCRLASVAITGLTGGGTMTMTIHNAPESGDLEVVKTSEDGKVSGISFVVEQYEPEGGIGWWELGTYVTDASGKFSIQDFAIGTQLRITEIVPDGYECTSENPQTVTITRGTNTVTFTNKPFAKLEIIKSCSDGKVSNISFKVEQYEPTGGNGWWTKGTYKTNSSGKIEIDGLKVGTRLRVTEIVPDGYVCNSENPQTVTLVAGTNTLNFENEPVASLEIVKTSTDGIIANISFTVEQYEPTGGIGWWTRGTYTTDADGKITIEGLKVGTQLRVTEIIPDGYVCNSENPQTVTLVAGKNTLSYENEPLAELEIIKASSDGKVDGISFKVERLIGRRWRTLGTYETDSDGKISIPNLRVGYQLRVTETVPENYICLSDNPQTLTLVADTNTVRFENKPVVRLELLKTSDDGNVDGIDFMLSIRKGQSFVDVDTYTTHDGGRISVEDLTLGATYRLTETVPEGYVGETPVQEFVAQLGTNSVTFVNRLIKGDLKIVKVDKASRTPLQGAGYRLYPSGGRQLAEGYTDENGELSFTDLPYGTYTYQEFATPEGFALDETVYTLAIRHDGEEIVQEHENSIIEGAIHILKTDEQGRPMQGVVFKLKFSVNDGETWTPIQHRAVGEPVQAGYCTADVPSNGTLTTGADGKATYTGLCIDTQLGSVLYRLTEVSTQPGYTLLSKPAFEGSLPYEEQIEVTITAVNHPEFQLPATGGHGMVATTAVTVLACLAAAVAFLSLRRKERKVK